MFEKLIGEKIEILPKTPKENQKLCDRCGGTGWLYDRERGFLEPCRDCYNGVIDLCPRCHNPKRGICINRECRDFFDKQSEQKRYDKAIKVSFDDAPKECKEMLYSECYGYNEGYFTDVEEFIDYCQDNEIEIPKYVWGTEKIKPFVSADSIVEDACENLHEDAYSNICGIDELQEFLEKWWGKQSGIDTFLVNYEYAILLNEIGS